MYPLEHQNYRVPTLPYFFLLFVVYINLLLAPPYPKILTIWNILYLKPWEMQQAVCDILKYVFSLRKTVWKCIYVVVYSICSEFHGMSYSFCLAKPFIYWVIWDTSVFWQLWMNMLWMFALQSEYLPLWDKFTSIQFLGRLIWSQIFKAFLSCWALSYSFKDVALWTAIWFCRTYDI